MAEGAASGTGALPRADPRSPHTPVPSEPMESWRIAFTNSSCGISGQPPGASMKVQDSMTRDVRIASPSQTVLEAARMMAELDIGVLPVAENDRLVGMITDRDIVV